MKRKIHGSLHAFPMLVAALIAAWLQPAKAAVIYWDNSGGTANDWGGVANWSTDIAGGINPAAIPGTADIATFSATPIIGTAQTINLNAARSVLGLDFLSTVTAATTLQAGGTNRILTIGASGIIKAGTGAVTIGSATANQNVAIALSASQSWANNNNTGALTIVNGVSSSSAGTKILTLGGTSTAANTISGIVANGSGGVSIDKTGAGLWVLSGANTYTGGTTVTAGTLRGTVAGAFGGNTTATAISLAGGTLDLFNDTGTTFTNTNTTVTANSTVSANRLTSAATATTHTLGNLSIGAQTLNVTRGANITGAAVGGITFGATTLTGNANFAPAANAQLNLGAVGGNFTLAKSGAGTLVLTAAGTYTGGTAISNGLLQVNNNTSLNTQDVTISNGRLRVNVGVTIGNNIVVNSGVTGVASTGLIERNATTGVARLDGTITLNGSPTAGGTFYNNVNTVGNELYLAGAINGSATSMSQRDGRVIYAGGGSFAGNFVVTGTAVVGANNGIPVALNHQLGGSASATLDLNGFNQAVNGIQLGNAANAFTTTVNVRNGTLNLNGNITNVTGTALNVTHLFTGTTGGMDVGSTVRTLDVVDGAAAEDVVFDMATISGSGGITKNGAGTLSIGHTGGTVNMTGPLTISAGSLVVGRINNASTVNVGSINLSSGTTLNVDLGAVSDHVIAGAAVSGGTTVNINQLGGALTVGTVYPILTFSGTSPGITNFTAGPLPGHLLGNLIDTGTSIAFDVTGNDKIIWDGTNTTSWATGATGNWKLQTGGGATDFFVTDDVIFQNNPTSSTVDIAAAVQPSNISITNTIATTYTFTGAGGIAGTTGITKTGNGTAILRTPGTYTGVTTISEGVLEVDHDGGSLTGTSLVNVSTGATLKLTRDDADFTFNRAISGAGTVIIDPHTAAGAASRAVTISGANSGFSGLWKLSPTSANVGAAGLGSFRTTQVTPANLGSAAVQVDNGGQLWMSNNTFTNNITITGTGYAEAAGGTPLVETGFTYGGIGALRIDNGATLAGSLTLNGNAKIQSYGGTATISGSVGVTAATDLLVIGGGGSGTTIILTGTNNSGANPLNNIWINSGGTAGSQRLNIGNGGTTGTLGAGSVTIHGDAASNGVLGFDRSNGYTLASGQTISGHGNMATTFLDFDTLGAGFSNAGNTITLGTADPNAGGGGSIRIGVARTGAVANLDGSITAGRLISSGNGAVVNFNNGLTGNFGYVSIGEAANASGTVNQVTGATVNIAAQLRLGHFGTLTSTYNMNGGNLTLTGASPSLTPSTAGGGAASATGDNNIEAAVTPALVGGGIYLGNDGTGIFNHNGGTVTTNWIVLDNRGASGAGTNMVDGIDRYNLSGASSELKLRSNWGLIGRNEGSYAVSFGGGTVKVDNNGTGTGTGANITVPLDVTIDTVAASTTKLDTNGTGNGFTLTKDVRGTGTLELTGGGTLNLSTTTLQSITALLKTSGTGISALNKTGTGTTTLSDVTALAAPINVNAGKLILNGNFSNAITVADGASLVGEPSNVTTLTLGSTTGSTLFFDPATPGALTTGTLIANGVTTLDALSTPVGSGPFPVINFTTSAATPANFAVANVSNYRTAPTVNVTASAVEIGVTAGLDLTWTGANSNAWVIGGATSNWNNASPAPDFFYSLDNVTLPEGAPNASIVLTGLIAPGNITASASTTNYTLTSTAGNQLTGGTGITKTGNSTLTLVGPNLHRGITSIGGGSVSIADPASLGDATVSSNTISLSSGGRLNLTAAANLGANRDINLGTGGGVLSYSAAAGGTVTIPGDLSGSGALQISSTLAGGGTFALTGSNSGYSGAITVDSLAAGLTTVNIASQLSVPAATSITLNYPALGAAGNATSLNLGSGVTLPVGTTLNFTSLQSTSAISLRTGINTAGSVTINSPITLSGSSIIQFSATTAATTTTFNGDITEKTPGAFAEAINPFSSVLFLRGSGLHVVNGKITLPSAGSTVAITDGAVAVINSTGNNFKSANAAFGTLRIGAHDALPTSARLVVGQAGDQGALFDLNGFNQTVAGLEWQAPTGNLLTKGITNSHASTFSTFTLNQGTAPLQPNFNGTISGRTHFVKDGAATVTLAAAASTFTGNVTVNDGILVASGVGANAGTAGSLGAANVVGKSITVNTPGTLNFTVNNIFGNGVGNANLPSLVVNGTTVSTAHYNVLGNTTLSGATLAQTSVATGDYQGFQFRGNVTVGGSAPSTISTTNARGTHLGANTLFTVADATGDSAADLVVSAPLVNQSGDFSNAAGGFTKAGPGTMSLTGVSTYTGQTTVAGGTLLISSSATVPNAGGVLVNGGGILTVQGTLGGTTTLNPGAILNGSGTVGNVALVGGTISPGNSPGILNTGGITTTGASTFLIDINGNTTAGVDFDRINVLSGNVDIGAGVATLSLNMGGGYIPALDDRIVFLNNIAGLTSGSFANPIIPFATPTYPDGYWQVHTDDDAGSGTLATSGNDISVVFVPEPGSMALFALSLLGLAGRRRRKV